MTTILLGLPDKVRANDGLFYTTGNQLVPCDETTIRVSKEVLSIQLNPNGTATVDVYYEFLNPEQQAQDVTVGFVADAPQFFTESQLKVTEHPIIKFFLVEMNDTALNFRHAVVANDSAFQKNLNLRPLDLSAYEEDESGSGNYLDLRNTLLGTSICYVYYFQAHFNPGVNRVHHRYIYTMGANVCTHYQLNYKLSPALRWSNRQIDDFTLRISGSDGMPLHFFLNAGSVTGAEPPAILSASAASPTGKYRKRTIRTSEYDTEGQDVLEFSLRKASVEFHAKNFKPREELLIQAADCSESGIGYKVDPCKKNICAEGVDMKVSKLDALAAGHYEEAMQGQSFKNVRLQKYFEARWWYMKQKPEN